MPGQGSGIGYRSREPARWMLRLIEDEMRIEGEVRGMIVGGGGKVESE